MSLITVSVVSHGHGALLPGLVESLVGCTEIDRIILTRNIPEPDADFKLSECCSVLDNARPKGFAANHNAAFRDIRTPYFLVINPDVQLADNPFPALLDCIEREGAALVAPAVVNPAGTLEDSARQFPSIADLVRKAFGRYDGRLAYSVGGSCLPAPWVGGMFMLFRSADYSLAGGFDEGFYLYYEDVDICARLWKAGRRVMLCPEVQVVHDARRASRRDLRHMRWHAASASRFLRKHGLNPKVPLW